MSKYGQPCTRSAVREYLEAAYLDALQSLLKEQP